MRTQGHAIWKNCPIWARVATRSFAFASLVALLPSLSLAQATSIQIPSTTPLAVQLFQHVPMKTGESLEGRLLYPVYVENQIAIPAGTVIRGSVIQLDSDRSRRIHSRLRGDFTPFHVPVVRFDQLLLPDGTLQAIVSDGSKDGVPILRLSPPPGKRKGSFISRQIAEEKQRLKDAAAVVTAPGRADRLVQFIYTQLPYHPERIETGKSWTVELAPPLTLKFSPPGEANDPPTHVQSKLTVKAKPDATAPPPDQGKEWRLRAYLQQTISSANEKPGDTFQAVVAEPVFNPDHSLVVPQGSLLIGEVTQAKPARSFSRQGRLRFHFTQLKLPTGFSQPVQAALAGIDSNKSADLQVDSEGAIQPQSRNRVVLPLLFTLLSARAYDEDGNHMLNSALGSNGFGLVGRVVGIVTSSSSRNVGASLGIYGALLAVYDLWLARGHNVVFLKNT